MPYIPNFNKLSLQEMAYAPTLMRQQHDEAIVKNMELSDALKFDYLKQDASTIEPVLQKYSEDIGKVSQDLAKSGFTQDTKGKILGLRSQFTGDDKIRHIKKQYSDAMEGWGEQKKALIQKGASGDLLNKQKASYFGSYKGAFDNEGFKQDFTPGRTSGVYDPIEDTSKLMKNLGEFGVLKSLGNSYARIVYKKDPVSGQSIRGIEVVDRNTGQLVENSAQVLSMLEGLSGEYLNSKTDRGLWREISEQNPDELLKTITDVANAHLNSRYAGIPQESSRWSPMDSGDDKSDGDGNALLTYGNAIIDSEQFQNADERSKILSGEIKGVKTGISDAIKGSEGYVDADNPFQISRTKVRTADEVALEQNKRTPRYKDIFTGRINPETKKPYTDIDIAKIGAEAEKNASAYIDKSTAMNIDKKSLSGQTAAEVVLLNMINPDNKTPLTQINGKWHGGDKKISKAKFMEIAGTDWTSMPVQFYNNGAITITDFSGNKFKVNTTGDDNKGVLEQGTSKLYNEVYVPILNKLTAFNLHDDDALDSPIQAPDGYLYDVVTPEGGDPYNVGHRLVRRSVVDPTSKERYQVGPLISPEQFKQEFLKQTASSSKNIQVQ